MQAAKRIKSLSNCVSARLTPEEEDLIDEQSRQSGLTKSEWCRRVILQALETSPESRLLLSELLALRRILMALQLDGIHGLPLTELRLQQVVDEAESKKFALADSRILALKTEQQK